MDTFDFDSVDKFVKLSKRKIINKLETYNLTERELKNHSDLLCMVLDYSPRTSDKPISYDTVYLKNVNVEVAEATKQRTYLLEKQTHSSSDEEKESKPSKFSNKLDKESEKKVNVNLITKSNNEFKVQIKNLVFEIIDNSIQKAFKSTAIIVETESKNDSDDDFDYDAIDKRRNIGSHNVSASFLKRSIASKLGDSFKIRVYFFKTKSFFDFSLFFNETVKDLKQKIFDKLVNDKALQEKYKIKNLAIGAFEIRMVEDDDDFLPNMDFADLDDKINLYRSGNKMLCVVEKKDFDPQKDLSSFLGKHLKNNEYIVTLKIYLKYETGVEETTIIEEGVERTLRNVLERLSGKSKLPYKNFEYFYFVEHHDSKIDFKTEDIEKQEGEIIDNEISLETQLKYLNFFELDLFFKKFQDAPESVPLSFVNEYAPENQNGSGALSKKSHDSGREFIFNDITAGVYQEFEVVKINPYKSRQERILGIDRYNIINNMPKSKIQASIMNFLYGGTKRPLRKTKEIVECDVINNKSFYIILSGNEASKKKVIYEVKSINVRNEIVAKIKYIMKMNQNFEDKKS